MRKAIFPGTFDPFTIGHYSVVERALTFMDEIIIGIGINENKNTYFPIEKREEMIRNLYKDNPRIKVMSYDCLTIDFAQQVEAQFIVRGIRTVKDFEYEETIADINRKLPLRYPNYLHSPEADFKVSLNRDTTDFQFISIPSGNWLISLL